MDVDESFTRYVALRWSTLHRLATLLVGAEAAERVTRSALVRAYVSWADLGDSPDESVTRVLAREAVRGDPTDLAASRADPLSSWLAPTGPTPDERLWNEVCDLLPHQRALLVLRHYEGFSDPEIAAALGCREADVTDGLLALETGVDLAQLRRVLVRRSETTTVPPPPLVELVASGRAARPSRRRRRWSWAAAGAAATALVVVVATFLDGGEGPTATGPAGRDTERPFLAGLLTGGPPRVAHSTGQLLRLAVGRTVLLPDHPTALVQTRRWLYVVLLSGEILRVDPATAEMRTMVRRSQGQLVTDPSGEHVAWLAARPGRAVVVAQTVSSGAVAISDEQAFPARPRCCDNPFVIVGMSQAGEVVASLPAAHRSWVWPTPDGGDPEPVRELTGLADGQVTQVTAVGVVVRVSRSQHVVGRLEEGRFVRTAAVSAGTADFTDPEGHRVVYATADDEVHVREIRFRPRSRRGAQDVQLQLPAAAGGYDAVRWEDGSHVLLDVADASLPHGALVRCAVDSGSCEIAVTFTGPHLLAR